MSEKIITCGFIGEFEIGKIYPHPLYGEIKILQWFGSLFNNGRFEHMIKAELIDISIKENLINELIKG